MRLFEKEQEPVIAGRIGDVKAQIEAKKNEIDQREKDLQTQLEMERQNLAEMGAELKEIQWQEKLERVEKQLVQLYREERKKENEINQATNKVFNKAARDVKKINFMFKDLDELKKNISSIENQLIQSDDTHDIKIQKAIEFKKAEIIREIEVTEGVKGGVSLVSEVNVALGIQYESNQELFGRITNRLPIYAQNIYDEVMRAGGKPVKAKEDELIRVARIPEPRIIKARDELKKNLKVLVEKDLITYEAEGKTLILQENNINV